MIANLSLNFLLAQTKKNKTKKQNINHDYLQQLVRGFGLKRPSLDLTSTC